MTAKHRKPLKHKKLIITLSIILSVLLVIGSSVIIFLKIGEARLREKLTFEDEGLTPDEAYGDTAEVYHNGQGYIYNDNLINILCIGADKKDYKYVSDIQADALYLLSLNTETEELNAIAISRNTLTDIDIYDMNNEFMATEKAQICLSYAYGKNDKQATLLTCKAVSRLMYNIPINAYYTVFLDSIGEIVDAVGGVEVVVNEDMTNLNPSWKVGKKVKLNKYNATKFIQYRNDSNGPRLERQKQFINNFMVAAKNAVKEDLLVPLDLFKKLSKHGVTDIDTAQVSYLATEMINAKFKMNSLSGKSGFDGMFETFETDEEALYAMVLDLFYIKTN